MSADMTTKAGATCAPGAAAPAQTGAAHAKPLPAAAERALAEAAARRAADEAAAQARPKEVAGRAGLDPTRYGDWERKGIASDF